MSSVEDVANAVMYEGYILWPYRRSARKNQHRWTFGSVYPPTTGEASWMQTQCLVTSSDRSPSLAARVRFLQVVRRRLVDATGADVDELMRGAERYLAWDEARERDVHVDTTGSVAFEIPAGQEIESLGSVGAIVRSWERLQGDVSLECVAVRDSVFRVTVRITNTATSGSERNALMSTHTILSVDDGEFVSMTDPPEHLADLVEACENVKTWPVLAGEAGQRATLLSAPIILYDYPRIAPESRGDLFDAVEIDQMLALNVMALTDAEKAEMRATDPRVRDILERTERFTAEDMMSMHGTLRKIGPGSRVRVHPRGGGDVMDLVLSGKVAIVESIEQDYESRVHVAVTFEDDPGRDLGAERMIGHRFFYAPDELEPLG